METLILDGSHATDLQSTRILVTLKKHLPDAETVVLREQIIGNCAGDFFCWVRSPGMCNTDDENRVIAAKILHCDLVIYLTPVTFGGYSSELKRMVDHQIQKEQCAASGKQGDLVPVIERMRSGSGTAAFTPNRVCLQVAATTRHWIA